MNRRPISVTIIGWLFIAAGIVGIAYHATEITGLFDPELIGTLVVRLLALAGGVFLLRGANRARWLLLAWMAYHVILSAFHPVSELIMHGVLLAAIAYVLFRAPAAAYFRGAGRHSEASHNP